MKKMKTKSKDKQNPHIMYKVEPYKPFKITRIKKFLNHYFKYTKRFFIVMQRTNGTVDAGYVYHDKNMFVYEDGIYLVDRDYMKWSDSLNSFVGYYTQGISLPLNFTVKENTLIQRTKDTIETENLEANYNPHVLFQTMNSEMIQKVMQGESLGAFFGRFQMLVILCLVGIVGIGIMLYSKLF